jgi:hypothetical protein
MAQSIHIDPGSRCPLSGESGVTSKLRMGWGLPAQQYPRGVACRWLPPRGRRARPQWRDSPRVGGGNEPTPVRFRG